MTGIILDAVLMLLLVAAIGYGIRLEKKLTQLRTGQQAFAGAVTELNTAAGRAENALASLRMSGEEADMLHDRILKARTLKLELEGLIAKGGRSPAPAHQGVEGERAAFDRPHAERNEEPDGQVSRGFAPTGFPARAVAERPPTLAARGRESVTPSRPAPMTAVRQALAANQVAQQSLNRARRSMDEDLFAA